MSLTKTLFRDRKDAAEQLAIRLSPYFGSGTRVLGIPRGGVEIAYYVAAYLKTDFSVIISKKIPHPQYAEFGIGAVCEGDEVYLPGVLSEGRKALEPLTDRIKEEVIRRAALYRANKPLPDLIGHTVILADDGIATGVTFVPAIRVCRKMKAEKIIVAAPVSGKDYDTALNEADEVIVLDQPEPFFGVGQAYADFSQLTDENVLKYIK